MKSISNEMLAWHTEHGRHDLPWQNTADAYRIWVSEIMLQQTQVSTVIDYYTRFMQHFPTVIELANASIDDVLHLWTGLGYYARARNLHKAAITIANEHNGEFPREFEQVIALPGIGQSTAGAVLAFSTQQRFPILDGNVKRVLSRFYEVEGWYGKKSVENQLWELADHNTPHENVHIYTQAIMDFGATLCTRSKPKCAQCPLSIDCKARLNGRTKELPHGKPKTIKPIKQTHMLLIKNDKDEFLLKQNPPSGIWGGLWCPPQVGEIKSELEIDSIKLETLQTLPIYKHTFSHYHLEITPVLCRPYGRANSIAENTHTWYKLGNKQAIGLAAPVKALLKLYA